MEESLVELGYLPNSCYSHTFPLLIPYCMDRVGVSRKFVVDFTCTHVAIKISVKCTNAPLRQQL